jgi:23S rRNA pseudouridine1911/1915/1917 synthase
MTTDPLHASGSAIRVVVAPERSGQRLDRFLTAECTDLSRSRLKALLLDGHIDSRDGDGGAATITDPAYRVKPGQSFEIRVPPASEPVPQPEDIPLQVVYEDADLIVIDKPAGLVVHPAAGNPTGTLVNALLHHCGSSLSGIGGVKRPGIVHRLDKDTSGLMVCAKNDAAHRPLSAQFEARTVGRAYLAIVKGQPQPASGRIEAAIGRHPRARKKMAVVGSGGKPAATRYKTLEIFRSAAEPLASLVECRLETGRTHQVRVHMMHLGHPLLADCTYGRAGGAMAKAPPTVRQALEDLRRQALHATDLGFQHPVTKEDFHFTSAPPNDMQRLLDSLRMMSKG